MARSGMTDIISRVRRLIGDSGTAQFTDDQIQDTLDQHGNDVRYTSLMAVEDITPGGSISYTRFWAIDNCGQAVLHWEGTAGTALVLQDANWSTVTGSATHNTLEGKWTFAVEPLRPIYITGRYYDIEGAAADLCEEWIADLKKCVTFSDGNVKFDLNAQISNLEGIIERLRRRQAPHCVHMSRHDINPSAGNGYGSDDPRARNSELGESYRW